MFCRKCGSQIPDDAIFCGYCGFKDVPFEAEQKTEAAVSANAAEPAPEQIIEESAEKTVVINSAPVQQQSAPAVPLASKVNPEVVPELFGQPPAANVQSQPQRQPANSVPAANRQQMVNERAPEQHRPVTREKTFFEKLPEEKFAKPVTDINGAPAKKKGPGVGGTIISVLLAIVIFVVAFLEMAILTTRESISSESVREFVSKVEPDDYLGGRDGRRLDKAYKLPSVQRFIKRNASDYSEYLLGGKKPKGVSTDDILDVLDDNLYEIAVIYDFDPDDFRFDKVRENFDENGEELLGVFSADVRTNDELELVRMLLSVVTLVLIALLLVGAVALLIAVQKNFKGICLYLGIPLIAVSVPYIGFGLFSSNVADGMQNVLFSSISDKFVRNITSGAVSDLVSHVSVNFLINGAIVLACGAVVTAIGILWGKLRKR